MKTINIKIRNLLVLFLFFAFLTYTIDINAQNEEKQNTEILKLDPELLILLNECQNITSHISEKLYPDWNFQKTPILFYRPNVQELLINYPHKPKGFSVYSGFNPLKGQTIYVRNDTTFITYDDQNTTYEVEGVKVLVVADTYSSMRSQLRGVIMNQSKEFLNGWLDNWGFIGSPYHKLSTILHEGFHVYQEQKASGKNADERKVANYPFLDPVNNSLYVLEGNILKDALFAEAEEEIMRKINEFVAVRTYRQSLLDSVFVAYENLNEFVEGTAKYVEYKFFSQGEDITPIEEMKYVNGFTDYKSTLPKLFRKEIEDMVNIVSVNDNRFGNKFGAGPLRFKLYYLGACQGLLLDKVMPEWKERIFDNEIYLSDLLKEAANLSNKEMKKHLKEAKSSYCYDQIYKEKLEFEKEGIKTIQIKVNTIMDTENTLVVIDYKGHKITGMSYTPFGVTKVDDNSIIYDMTPVDIYFDKTPELISKMSFPIMINSKDKKIYFSVDTPPDEFSLGGGANELLIEEFELIADEYNIVKEANRIYITFK